MSGLGLDYHLARSRPRLPPRDRFDGKQSKQPLTRSRRRRETREERRLLETQGRRNSSPVAGRHRGSGQVASGLLSGEAKGGGTLVPVVVGAQVRSTAVPSGAWRRSSGKREERPEISVSI
jgi:hypothetical protein